MKPVLINGYLYWLDGDKLWDANKVSFTTWQFMTTSERKQAEDCITWNADINRVNDYLNRNYSYS